MKFIKSFALLAIVAFASGCASEGEESDEATTEGASEDALSIPVNTKGHFWEVEVPRSEVTRLLPSSLEIPKGATAKLLLYVAKYDFPIKDVTEGTILVPDVSFKAKHDCEGTRGERFYYLAQTYLDSKFFIPSFLPYTRHVTKGKFHVTKDAVTVEQGANDWTLSLQASGKANVGMPIDTSRSLLGELPKGAFAKHSLEFDVKRSNRISGSFEMSSGDGHPTRVSTAAGNLTITYVESRGHLSPPSYCR